MYFLNKQLNLKTRLILFKFIPFFFNAIINIRRNMIELNCIREINHLQIIK